MKRSVTVLINDENHCRKQKALDTHARTCALNTHRQARARSHPTTHPHTPPAAALARGEAVSAPSPAPPAGRPCHTAASPPPAAAAAAAPPPPPPPRAGPGWPGGRWAPSPAPSGRGPASWRAVPAGRCLVSGRGDSSEAGPFGLAGKKVMPPPTQPLSLLQELGYTGGGEARNKRKSEGRHLSAGNRAKNDAGI